MQAYERLEAEWARRNGLDPDGMVACSSGTAALHLAYQANTSLQGTTALVPDYTMGACARAVKMAGLRMRLIDCLESDLTIDPDAVDTSRFYTSAVASVMAVHVYGKEVKMDRLAEVCRRGVLYLVEDLAEAHGVLVHPQTDAACWSFYKNKIVAGEEGGAVWFKDKSLATRARSLRSLGFLYDADGNHDYTHVPGGHNYRMSNAHAELVLSSLADWKVNRMLRMLEMNMYRDFTPESMLLPRPDAPWVHPIRLPAGADRRKVLADLRAEGVPVRAGFKPMSMQEEFRAPTGPVAMSNWGRVIYVCLEPMTLGAEVDRRCSVVKKVLELIAD